MATRKHWYKRWWGVVILILLAFFLLFMIGFFLYVARLVSQIRSGQAVEQGMTSLGSDGGLKSASGQAATLVTEDDPALGPASAKVTIVEFSDFQCPFCRQSFPVIREIEAAYRGKIRIIYRDFPITQIHQFALKSAEAGECADEQKKFWPYHDKLFTNQERLDVFSLKEYARQVGLDEARFNTCLEAGKYQSEVVTDFNDGLALGVGGTPTWFINGRKLAGVISVEAFKRIIDAELAK